MVGLTGGDGRYVHRAPGLSAGSLCVPGWRGHHGLTIQMEPGTLVTWYGGLRALQKYSLPAASTQRCW